MAVERTITPQSPERTAWRGTLGLGLARIGIHYIRRSPFKYKKAGVYTHVVEPNLFRHLRNTETRTERGGRIFVSGQDVIQRYIYSFGVWEPALTNFVKTRLRAGDTFIDVGANIGYYALLASGLVGASGTVVSIEASPSI